MGYRSRFRRRDTRQAVAAVAVALGLAAAAHASPGHHHHHPRPSSPGRGGEVAGAAIAIAYARAQIGKPYLWGATGPDAFDCSGLTMRAEQAAGIQTPRTSEEQWAGLRHVPWRERRPGMLVFFAGFDGTPAAPGHVGLIIGRKNMIEAYATGVPIRVSQYGTAASAPGDQTVVGFARP
jgi:cell wall-associated NlpC family hydrolase